MIINNTAAIRRHPWKTLFFVALILPVYYMGDLLTGWFITAPETAFDRHAIPLMATGAIWAGFFVAGERWDRVIGYTLLFIALALLINGLTMAAYEMPPALKPPLLYMSDQFKQFMIEGGQNPGDLYRRMVPDMPLPSLIFAFIAAAGVVGGFGWMMMTRGSTPDFQALLDLEAKYKQLNGISKLYESDLAPWMEEQETRRRDVMQRRTLTYISSAPLLVAVLVGMSHMPTNYKIFHVTMLLKAAMLLVGLGAIIYFSETPVRRLKEDIKARLSLMLADFLKLRYTLFPTHINIKAYDDLQLLPVYDRTYISDLFEGGYKGINLRLSKGELWITGRHRRCTFSGALVEMQFPRPFSGTTKVLYDRGLIGNAFMNKLLVKEQRVGLSYSAFENVFEAYSTDQVEARALLTPDIIENIIKLSTLLSGTTAVQFAFHGNSLLMAIKCQDEFLEMNDMDRPMTDRARISRFVEEVTLVHTIIDMLNLKRQSL